MSLSTLNGTSLFTFEQFSLSPPLFIAIYPFEGAMALVACLALLVLQFVL